MTYSSRHRSMPRVRRRGSRILTKLLVTLIVLVAIAAGIDVVARELSESWLGGAIETSLNLPERPNIELRGFPFLTQVRRERIIRAEVEADVIEVQGLELQEVTLDLRRVRFTLRDLFNSGADELRADRGRGRARITDAAFTTFIQSKEVPLSVQFERDRVRVTGLFSAGGVEATARTVGPLTLEGNELVFMPTEVEVDGSFGVPLERLSFRVPLPSLGEGVTYEGVTIRRGAALLRIRLVDATLTLADEA